MHITVARGEEVGVNCPMWAKNCGNSVNLRRDRALDLIDRKMDDGQSIAAKDFFTGGADAFE